MGLSNANNGVSQHWNRLYSKQESREGYVWSKEPSKFITDLIPILIEEGCKTVLDAGCGDGRNLVPFMQQGFIGTGVDASKEALIRAEENFRQQNLEEYRLFERHLDNLVLDSCYDVITSTKVFKHIWNTETVVESILQYLEEDGTAILEFATTNDSSYNKCASLGHEISKNQFKFHDGTLYRFYEKSEIEQMCSRLSGKTIKQIEYWDEPHAELSERRHRHESWVVIGRRK